MILDSKLKVQIPLALGLSLLSAYSTILPVRAEITNAVTSPASNTVNTGTTSSLSTNTESENLSKKVLIKNIYLNDNKELVVEFDNPSHTIPDSPQVRDYPGQPHDIVLEFSQASFAVDKAPKAKAVLDELMKVYPGLSSIAYATANDGTKARIRIGVAPNIDSHPALTSIGEGSAIINLGLPVGSKPAETPSVASTIPETKGQTNTPPANSTNVALNTADMPAKDSSTNVTAKTVNSIKGAWFSSLKAGHNQVNKLGHIAKLSDKVNPLGKFGHAKHTDTQSVPANTGITASAPIENTPDKVEPPQEAKIASSDLPEGNHAITTNSEDTSPPTTITPPTANTTAITSDIPVTNPAATTDSAAPAPKDNLDSKLRLSELQPDSTSAKTEAIEPSPAPVISKITEPEKIITEQPATPTLPRISALAPTSEVKTTDNETLITPLSVEQVLKEKASQPPVEQPKLSSLPENTNVGQPITSKETVSTTSIASDIKPVVPTDEKLSALPESKTNEAEPVAQAQAPETVEKKEEANIIATLPTNSLDALTSAASKNEAETTDTNKAVMPEALPETVPLKAQKARISGKDYLPPKFSDEAVDHYNKAVRFHLDGKLANAIVEYKAACAADSQIAEAYSNLGLIYNQQRKYDQAMIEFHKALVINPKDAITYNGIGAAMRAKNNMVAAIKNWKTALALDPNLASAHYNLGTAYELDKDMEQALVEYKEAVKHDDKLGEAYYRMGLILQKMNNKHLALEEYKQAIKISQQATYAPDAKRRINLLSQSKNTAM